MRNQPEGTASMTSQAAQSQSMKACQAGQAKQKAGDCAGARKDFEEALKLAATGPEKAEAQLNIGLSHYEAKDYERAGAELLKVLKIPDADPKQIHEAQLRLRLRRLLPGEENVLTVLFIGASHTQVWNIPQIVEVLSASAPVGRPRIIAAQSAFGGNTLKRLWERGDGPDTPRGRIAAEPWDYLVMETFFVSIPGRTDCDLESQLRYAGRFADLARSAGITPVCFEAPAFLKSAYPADFQAQHDENLSFAKRSKLPLAPAAYACMKHLGPNPTTEQRRALYLSDGLHPWKKGAYMMACCVYTALTGCSPVGLTHKIPTLAPGGGLSQAEAESLQKTTWEACRETNADLRSADASDCQR